MLARFGAGHVHQRQLGVGEVQPGEQLVQLPARRVQLLGVTALHAFFRQIAAQVPHQAVVLHIVGGDGEPGFVAGAHAVGVEAVAQAVLQQHHFQGPALRRFTGEQLGFLGVLEQAGVAFAGGQHGQLRFNAHAVQGHRFQAALVPAQRVPCRVEVQQTVAHRRGEHLEQAFGVHHQIVQAVDLTLEAAVRQGGREIRALQLFDAPAQHAAGEEGGHAAGHGTGGPEVLGLAEHPQATEIHRALALDGLAPAVGHAGDGLGFAGEGAAQGVFQAAVDNALAGQGLGAAQGAGFQQQALIAALLQVVDQPQAGDAAAEDQDVRFQHRGSHAHGHGSPSMECAAMLA